MNRVLDALDTELDPAQRAIWWQQAQQIYTDDLPALPLFFKAMAFVTPPALQGLEPTGHQYPTTLWVEEWSYRP
jgi:peptide/nickel transport system substrate-binding protein